MKNIFQKIKNNKLIFAAIFLVVVLCFGVGINSVFAQAPVADQLGAALTNGVGQAVSIVLGFIAMIITSVVGLLITLLVKIIINVAQYNEFINVPAVNTGWVIIRDIFNMFFILILLVIAFATILRVESYNAKKLLPKLLIAAVLINFSKTIFGLIIDFAQVIMLTFVSAFAQGHGMFIAMFNVDKLLSFDTNCIKKGEYFTTWSTVVAIIGGVIASLITLIVMAIFLAILVMRVIMLWIYVILSPIVIMGSAFPFLQKYSSQIWQDFIKQVIVGPVLAFFIWLALIIADSSSIGSDIGFFDAQTDEICAGANAFFSEGNFQKFIITVGFLVGGLMVAQQIGGAAGGLAGKGLGWAKKVGKLPLQGADLLNRIQGTRTGFDLNPFRQTARIKAGLERSKARDLTKMETIAGSRLQKGGFTGAIGGFTAMGWADHHIRGFLGYEGIRSAFFGGEKKVGRLRGEETEARWRAKHVFADKNEFNKKKLEYLQKAGDARQYGNMDEYKEKMKDIQKMKDYGDELVVGKEDVPKIKDSFLKLAENKAKKAASYTVMDYQGRKARRAAENEEASKITSTNEDELTAQFEVALAQNNSSLAGALARKIAQVGGFNSLLNKFGYQASAGLNRDETEALIKAGKKEEVMEQRGFNDFMRDIFEKRLGMDEQSTLTLQSDIGGIGEGINHEYLIKTVGVDETGKFYQTNNNSRTMNINIEKSKMEREGVIRKGNRLNYGSEDKTTGKYKWTASGLTEFVNNWKLIGKEIDGARFNRSTAAKVVEPEAIATLERVMKKAETDGVLGEGFKGMNVGEFIKKLKNYAKSSGEEGIKKISKTINEELKK